MGQENQTQTGGSKCLCKAKPSEIVRYATSDERHLVSNHLRRKSKDTYEVDEEAIAQATEFEIETNESD